MATMQRNAPCSCGSGRKQKQCCGKTAAVGDFARTRYLRIVDRILDPAPPAMVNTDGDALAPTTLVYDLECDCDHAFDKLKMLAKGHKPSQLLKQAEVDRDGRLRQLLLPWIDSRKPGSPGMGPTILGQISIETGRLEIDVNSTERADRIRSRISRRLGAKARLRQTVSRSLEEMFADSDDDELVPEDQPEVKAAIARMMKDRQAAWYDESIPMLEGQTPRQAASTAEGRELLEALLAEYEQNVRRMPESPSNPDIAAMRRELGLV